ncbi:hypothetical protein [Faecalispora jeddahensis]|uniref:hypothetical protein n=1 Tax=Faecalispora jeddahensis TaxID=1414721 RepID=UPI0028A64B3C|nr:hypothetical protein [Faecalispora jeddahensis]
MQKVTASSYAGQQELSESGWWVPPLTRREGTRRKLPSLERKSALTSFAKRKKHTAASPLSLKLFYHKYPDRSSLKKSARAVSVSMLKTAEKEFYVAFYQPKLFRKTNITTSDPSIFCSLERSRKSERIVKDSIFW